jgi:hypothetical protein
VVVLGSLGEAQGYAIMAEFKGPGRRRLEAEPGGHLSRPAGARRDGHVRTADRDGTHITRSSRPDNAPRQQSNTRWASLTARARGG